MKKTLANTAADTVVLLVNLKDNYDQYVPYCRYDMLALVSRVTDRHMTTTCDPTVFVSGVCPVVILTTSFKAMKSELLELQ